MELKRRQVQRNREQWFTDAQMQAFCRLVAAHELVEKEWLEPMPQRPDLTKFYTNLKDDKELRNYVKDTITARYPDLFLP